MWKVLCSFCKRFLSPVCINEDDKGKTENVVGSEMKVIKYDRYMSIMVEVHQSRRYLVLLSLYFSASFWFACSSPPTFETKSRRNFGYIFPEQSGDPLTRNWTRQPEVYCLFYPKHTTVITPCTLFPRMHLGT